MVQAAVISGLLRESPPSSSACFPSILHAEVGRRPVDVSISWCHIKFFGGFPFHSNKIPTSHQFVRPCMSWPAWLPSPCPGWLFLMHCTQPPSLQGDGAGGFCFGTFTCAPSSLGLHFWASLSAPPVLSRLSGGPSLKILSKLVSSWRFSFKIVVFVYLFISFFPFLTYEHPTA